MTNERRTRRKKKKRFRRIVLPILLLLILIIGGCSVFQFYQGKSQAGKGFETDGNLTFNGKAPNIDNINVLLLGSDSRGEKHARTDSIMIAHYNGKTNTPKVVSIMRDTYVDIPGHGKNKINAAYAFGGPELLRQTIKENFDIDIQYYAIVDFKGFEKMVDIVAPDGIEVDIPYKMSHGLGLTLYPGKQKLHGKELLGYVRFRHDRESDFGRVRRQQEVIGKLKEEAISVSSIVKLPKLLGTMDPYLDSNVPNMTLLSIGTDFVTKQAGKIESLRIPVDGSYEDARYENAGSVLKIDLDKNKEAMQDFLSQKSSDQKTNKNE